MKNQNASEAAREITAQVRVLCRRKTQEERLEFMRQLECLLTHQLEQLDHEDNTMTTEQRFLHLESLLDVTKRDLADFGETWTPEDIPQRIDDLQALISSMETSVGGIRASWRLSSVASKTC